MKPRLARLVPVEKPGHLVVELPEHGPHHLRLPTWSTSTLLARWARTVPNDGDWGYFAVLVAASWRHESLELESVMPDFGDGYEARLSAYSTAVQLELEESGYTNLDLARLGAAVLDALTQRQRKASAETREATNLADFSAPPTAATSSP